MRVGLYIDSYFPTIDGVVITVKNYADWLNDYGHKTHVATLYTGYYENKDAFPVYRFKSLPTFFRKEYKLALTRLDLKTLININKEPVDIVHTHSPFGLGHSGLRYARSNKIPIVTTFHTKFYDDFLEVTKSPVIARFIVKQIIKYYNKCDYVWTVNASTAETLRDYGYKGNIEIMPNGYDDSFIKISKNDLPSVKEEYKIPDNFDIFLFVGRLTKTKNIQLILESMTFYKKHNSNFILFLVGQGDNEAQFKQMIKDLDLYENVIFTGKVFDRRKLISLYKTADLFLFPSVYDNAPLVIREAAACETPSVTIKNSGAAENIVNGKNGFTCEENAIDINKTIINALKDKKKLTDIGKNAKKTIAIPWSQIVKDVAKRYEEIIKEYKKKTSSK